VADETHIARALELVGTLTEISSDATGTAGLAGVLATRSTIENDHNVGVVVSGVLRR
jgi:threonine dehydratase